MNTFLFCPHQGFAFESQGNVVLVWPLVPEATLWLHLITEALWPERAIFFNGALVVKDSDWSATFLEIYLAGWRWSFNFLSKAGIKPVVSNGGRTVPRWAQE